MATDLTYETSEDEDLPTNFSCDRCSHCCRTHRVPLTGKDVTRLEEYGQKTQKFVQLLSPDEIDMSGEPESFAMLKEGRRVLVLRYETRTNGCIFLGAAGCTVHPARPRACRTYPFDRPDKSGTLGSVPGYLCPPDTGVLVTLRRSGDDLPLEFVTALKERDAELSEYALFVESWNRRQRSRIRLGRAPESCDAFLERLAQVSGHQP